MTDYNLSRNYHVIGYQPEDNFGNHDQLIFEQKNRQREVSAFYLQSEIKWNK